MRPARRSGPTFYDVSTVIYYSFDGPAGWLEHFQNEGGEYLNSSLAIRDFGKSQLARRNIELIERSIQSGIAGRSEIQFIPIFNFLYRDGHEMLTMGGMIGGQKERELIAKGLGKADYYRRSLEDDPCLIEVPRLTRKERQYLDSKMPCKDGWTPSEFELSIENVAAYQKIYRYCPNYAELLL